MELDDEAGVELLFGDDTTIIVTLDCFQNLFQAEPTYPLKVKLMYGEEGVMVLPVGEQEEEQTGK